MNHALAPRPERYVFTALLALALVTGVAGFAPSYFLKFWFGTPPLKPLVHVHAALFSAWLALLVIQSALIRTGHQAIHRSLGKYAAALVVLMVVTGAMVVVMKPRPTEAMRAFIFTPLLSLLLFPAFVATAIHFRKDPATHKRLMLLATLLFMGAPVVRLMMMAGFTPRLNSHQHYYGSYLLLLVPLACYDLWRFRRLHPATLWGGMVLLLRHPLHDLIAFTPGWQHLVVAMTPAVS